MQLKDLKYTSSLYCYISAFLKWVPRGGSYLLGFKSSGSLPLFFVSPFPCPPQCICGGKEGAGSTDSERERVGVTGDFYMAVSFPHGAGPKLQQNSSLSF